MKETKMAVIEYTFDPEASTLPEAFGMTPIDAIVNSTEITLDLQESRSFSKTVMLWLEKNPSFILYMATRHLTDMMAQYNEAMERFNGRPD